MPNSKLLMGGLLAVGLVVSFACSNSDSSATTAEPLVSETSDPPTGAGDSGSGSATLTIGSESWTVSGVFLSCAFSPEEAGNAGVSFSMSGVTETEEGARLQLDATIQDPEEQGRYQGQGVIHSISIDDVGNFENPAVGWSVLTGAFGPSVDLIQVDGKSVTAEAMFDNQLTDAVVEKTPGTLKGTCP